MIHLVLLSPDRVHSERVVHVVVELHVDRTAISRPQVALQFHHLLGVLPRAPLQVMFGRDLPVGGREPFGPDFDGRPVRPLEGVPVT